MTESKLGDVFFEKAGQYPDASIEASAYMDICGACDMFNGDVPKVLEHFESEYLPRWRSIANNPNRGEAARKYWAKKVEMLEHALQELQLECITSTAEVVE